MAPNHNHAASPDDVQYFEAKLSELKLLMECRGGEAVEKLDADHGGVNGLCKKLKTSTHDGEFLFVCCYY